MIIDCHSHHISTPYNSNYLTWLKTTKNFDYGPDYLWNNPIFEDISKRIETMQANHVTLSVITYSANIVQIVDSAALEGSSKSKIITDLNNRAENIVKENSQYLVSTALIDLRLNDSILSEMERTSDWAVGFSVLAAYRINGKIRFLDDPLFEAFWKKAAELHKPVFIHFSSLYKVNELDNILKGYMNDSMLCAGMGQLMENTLCISRLAMSGLFDKYPTLKVVMGQLGGMYPFMLERFEMLYNMHLQGACKKGLTVTDPKDIAHFMRNFRNYTDNIYVDTHSMDANAIRCASEILGDEKILFGSDLPITPEHWGMEQGIKQITDSCLSEAAKEKILSENAKALLNAGTNG